MRPLNRPMFRYGGPIKEGVMSGIREPKKNGGKMLLVGQHPKEFRDASGREQHWLPLVGYGAAALRAIPTIYRGFKAARTFGPGTMTWGKRLKDTVLGSGRFRDVTLKKPPSMKSKPWIRETIPGKRMGILQALKDPRRFGMAMREYPITALTAATLPATGVDLTREHGKDVAKGGWNLIKRFGAAVIPGDQSSWYKDKPPVKDVPLNPNLQKNLQKEKTVIDEVIDPEAARLAKQKEWNNRIKKYRDIMDIKGMNKQAAYKSLVDASKLIQESQDFKGDIKSGKLINQVIQAASKQFDKPKATSDAIDTLILKGEIEKDIKASDPSNAVLNKLRGLQGEKLLKELNPSFSDMKVVARKNMDGQNAWDAAAASTSDNFRGNLIPNSEWVKIKKGIKEKSGELDDITIIAQWTTEKIKGTDVADGDYTVGDAVVTIQENQVIDVKR